MKSESPLQQMKTGKSGSKPEKTQAELRLALKQKFLALKPRLDEEMKIYQQALDNDDFEGDQGEKRQLEMQQKILIIFNRAQKIKKTLDSKGDLPDTQERDLTKLEPFLKEVFSVTPKHLDDQDLADLYTQENLDQLKQTDATKAGEYTLNPECLELDYEKAKITVLDITKEDWYKKLKNKDLASIAEYLVKNYSDKYIIPDLSFYQWMIEKGDKAPTDLKGGNWHFSFGSILRSADGNANVPGADWDGSKFLRDADVLADGWVSGCRVVLLERV